MDFSIISMVHVVVDGLAYFLHRYDLVIVFICAAPAYIRL